MGKLKDTARILKALSDEGRLRITMLLCGKEGLCVCEIKEVIGLSQPTISSHLKLLEAAGLLESEKEGLWVNYRLARDMAEDNRKLIDHLYRSLEDDRKIREDIEKVKNIDRYGICGR
ncbi:MAG: ArsR/SmtB family transcription factor [Actinomycetota bacterium]